MLNFELTVIEGGKEQVASAGESWTEVPAMFTGIASSVDVAYGPGREALFGC